MRQRLRAGVAGLACATACALAGCASTAAADTAGIQGADEELMAALAALARRGPQAICDPAALEQALKIRIGPLTAHREGPVNEQSSNDVVAATAGHTLRRGEFSIFSNVMRRHCSLLLEFKDRQLCDLRSGAIARVMGVPLRSATSRADSEPHEYSYDFGVRDGHRVGVGAGRSDQRCTHELIIGARQDAS